MGRNKGNNALAVAAASRSVKERHHRAARDHVAVPRNLIAIPEKNIRSKHQSYFQFFENKDRKDKKLEFQVPTMSYAFLDLRSALLLAAGHHRHNPSPGLRVRSHWQPGAYQGVQRDLTGTRRHDLHCLSVLMQLDPLRSYTFE